MRTLLTFALIAPFVPIVLAGNADPIAADEQALAVEIKKLEDLSPAAREAAAARIRTILERYPNRSTNLREADNGEARWKALVARVQVGMSEDEVVALLKPMARAATGPSDSEEQVFTYTLDRQWICQATYGRTGVIGTPAIFARLLQVNVWPPPPGFSGTWTTWYVNGQKALDRTVVNGADTAAYVRYHANGQRAAELVIANAATRETLLTRWNENGVQTSSTRYRANRPIPAAEKTPAPPAKAP